MVQALSQVTACGASLIGMGLSPAARDPNMVGMYAGLAGGMGVSAGVFWWVFGSYDEDGKGDGEVNNGGEDGGRESDDMKV